MVASPPFLSLCCIFVAVGCHNQPGTTSSGGGEESGASGEPSTGAGTGSSGGSSSEMGSSGAPTTGDLPEPSPYDLFQCGLERDCPLSQHYYMNQPGMPSHCAAQLVRSAMPGVMLVYPHYVPWCSDWMHLLILRGDGTVLVQFGTASEEACDILVPGPQQSCELDLPDDFAELEEWFPVVKNCVDADPLTCAGVLELLGE